MPPSLPRIVGEPRKKSSATSRRGFMLNTRVPEALGPWTWNTFFASPNPIAQSSSTDPSLRVAVNATTLGRSIPSEGRPPQHWKTMTLFPPCVGRGSPIASSRAESKVNFLLDARVNKLRQTRWPPIRAIARPRSVWCKREPLRSLADWGLALSTSRHDTGLSHSHQRSA